MSAAERNALRAATQKHPTSVHPNMMVRAYAQDANKYWAAVVVRVMEEDGEQCAIVKFSGCGTRSDAEHKVRVSELLSYEYVEIVEGKRTHTVNSYRANLSSATCVEETQQLPAEPSNNRGRKRRQRKREDNGETTVWRILNVRGDGDNREYFTVFSDGDTDWIERGEFFDDNGTVTAALLAFEWRAVRIVQTFRNGSDLLIAWKHRSSADWSVVPKRCFSPAELEALRDSPPTIPQFERNIGVERIYQSVIKAIRSSEHKHIEVGFPTCLAAAILGSCGVPLDLRHYGDQRLLRFTRENLERIFAENNFPDNWDHVVAADGGSIGKLDWANENAVTIRWYARKIMQPCYWAAVGEQKPVRKPDLWIDVLEVNVRKELSKAAVDQAIAAL